MFEMQISTQTENVIHFIQIAFIFSYKIPALWSLEVNKAILEEVKVAQNKMIICFSFLRN